MKLGVGLPEELDSSYLKEMAVARDDFCGGVKAEEENKGVGDSTALSHPQIPSQQAQHLLKQQQQQQHQAQFPHYQISLPKFQHLDAPQPLFFSPFSAEDPRQRQYIQPPLPLSLSQQQKQESQQLQPPPQPQHMQRQQFFPLPPALTKQSNQMDHLQAHQPPVASIDYSGIEVAGNVPKILNTSEPSSILTGILSDPVPSPSASPERPEKQTHDHSSATSSSQPQPVSQLLNTSTLPEASSGPSSHESRGSLKRDVSGTVLSGFCQLSIPAQSKTAAPPPPVQSQQKISSDEGCPYPKLNLDATLKIHQQIMTRHETQYRDYSGSLAPFDKSEQRDELSEGDRESDEEDIGFNETSTRMAGGLMAIVNCLGLLSSESKNKNENDNVEADGVNILSNEVMSALQSGGNDALKGILQSHLSIEEIQAPTTAASNLLHPRVSMLVPSLASWADLAAPVTRPTRSLTEKEKSELFSFLL